ncbi:Eukaryotic translation initiation factor 3 subunit G [Quillaja saponaria]|uniref:Eukaryotic translation initiation factor 3 subunit G n=1 Tax=Quillaja saponaria TaxID=32244 RepID=A0AAD7PP34_QUISA|nr:Eukaryotic translation initiation factor 3 subunit G [Quillaja saponaria]
MERSFHAYYGIIFYYWLKFRLFAYIMGSKPEEAKAAGDSLPQVSKGGAVLMVCRTCGKEGYHWTSRCPYKDLAQPSETFIDKPPEPKWQLLLLVQRREHMYLL